MICRKVKYKPKTTVKKKPDTPSLKFPSMIEWWPQVRLIPEVNKIRVFNRGTEKGSMASKPCGGQEFPDSGVGEKENVKNPQKKERKKRTSDEMNHPIDHFILFSTSLVCLPERVPSRTISRPHRDKIINNKEAPIKKRSDVDPDKEKTKLNNMKKDMMQKKNGHGLGFETWKGFISIEKRKFFFLKNI